MALEVPCPNCGSRPYTEFSFGGELRALAGADVEEDFRRVYLPENPVGRQQERWYHEMGCRRWFTLHRDTLTNRIEA